MTGQPVLARPAAEDSSDRELLARFVATGEQHAFALVLQRHGPAVLRLCRRLLGNEHDAEDVVQATFLTLARKAAVVEWQDSIKPWLQAVAQRLALQARGQAERRRTRETPASESSPPEPCDSHAGPLAELTRRELRLVLDEELGRLPEKYRAPVVLCYLDGRTNEQAAEQLGWPAGSMSRRLARARALLHARLSQRGLAFAVVLCCLALGAWLLRPEPHPDVAEVMTPLAGTEDELRRLADGTTGMSPAARRRLGERVARAAASLHGPGRDRRWHRLAAQMHGAALDLAEADDEPAATTAARRLRATCQNCHTTYRD